MVAVIFGTYDLMTGGHAASRMESSLFNGLHRTAWSIALSYLIIACFLGHGGKKIGHFLLTSCCCYSALSMPL